MHEVGETDGQPFIAMEYVDGGNLADRLRAHSLPPREAAEVIRAVALALQHAHEQGVLHRDVKPSNILFDSRDEVRITDFGLAKKLDGSTDLTLSGHLAGTPNYVPPEAAAGNSDKVAVPGDVYSLGAALSASTLLAVGAAFATLMISNREIRSAKNLAETRREESRQRLVRMNVAAGNKLVEEGAQLESLPYLPEALRLDAGHPERGKIHRQRFAAVRDYGPKLIEYCATGPVVHAAFDPTGGHIVSGFGPGEKICIWKPGSPGPDVEFSPIEPRPMYVFFDRAGRPFTADFDGALQRWDAGQPAGPLLPARVRTTDIAIFRDCVDFSPDDTARTVADSPPPRSTTASGFTKAAAGSR